ncbi:hypothetical protein RJ640_007200 [Escallonia rubra]|uniref:Dystrophia myotonica WD repeat-containing protein n=1 Tax=Escallonia rubra TaxID=112253 RepID=A0AA88QK20_9ASTE|nr:hypothetical protein RJ640_007200 [Escallonia rubra]
MMSSASSSTAMMSSSANNTQTPCLKAYFKTPEGHYKLQYEKTHPSGLLHYTHGKTVTQVTVARLKDKPAQAALIASSSLGVTGGVRSAAARFLGGGNGSRAFNFVGGNGTSKSVSGSSRVGSLGASSSNNLTSNSNFDGKGTYLIFNVGDAVFISDLNSQDKDPIKSIHFSNSNPVCHAFDMDAKDGHDLLIGFNSGDGSKFDGILVHALLNGSKCDILPRLFAIFLEASILLINISPMCNKKGLSLMVTFRSVCKKLHGNMLAFVLLRIIILLCRCTSIAWVPYGGGTFVVAHADGNFYVYEKASLFKDGSGDPSFPAIKDQTQFSVLHARYSKNPAARWHICEGPINSIAFSTDGAYIATVGRDGYLRVYDLKNEQLVCGGKSYYGALLCCAWSVDGKYVLTGGEDDLVQVWSMEDRKVVAWGEGHNSWVSGVAFDSYWSGPNTDGTGENIVYRFGSVGQDTQLLLWDLEMDEIVVPVRRPPGGSPTLSTGSQSSHWDTASPVGILQPAPSILDVPKISPLVAHRVHTEPLSGLTFTLESVLTTCREGHIKIWMRPGFAESQSKNSDSLLSKSLKEKQSLLGKVGSSSYRQ